MDRIMEQYRLWVEKAKADRDIEEELTAMEGHSDRIEDAFYKDLAFGTGGLRGIIGAGTNRMNVYTVARASQGVADYLKNASQASDPRVAVSYDSRIKSKELARVACGVFAANGIEAFLYPELMPTPCLSFAVRNLRCDAGIMITASHNPAVYNGYKVYDSDGCQITTKAAKDILKEIQKLDMFDDICSMPFEEGMARGMIRYIPEEVTTAFIEEVKSQSLAGKDVDLKKDVAVIYSPLNGTGLKPVLRVLKESGYTNITVVEEQENPDGNFPTCPYPNPEEREALTLGIRYAVRHQADLVLATDPDCDRVGIAVRNHDGEYVLLTGNETGMLLLDYVCARRTAADTMPANPVFMKTIVTAGMAERIAAHYGVKTVNVLTGFKFIGEQIGVLEGQKQEESFIFAFEESYGYLSGTYVRDKDGVGAALLICEMAAFYSSQGILLTDKLEELYRTYGYCLDALHCYQFEGSQGADRMDTIMEEFRKGRSSLGGKKVISCLDYKKGLDGLPPSNVLRFLLEDNCSVVVRPSGTEPKMKVYVSACGKNREEARKVGERIKLEMDGVCG